MSIVWTKKLLKKRFFDASWLSNYSLLSSADGTIFELLYKGEEARNKIPDLLILDFMMSPRGILMLEGVLPAEQS